MADTTGYYPGPVADRSNFGENFKYRILKFSRSWLRKNPEKGPGKFRWRRTFCPCQVNPLQFVIHELELELVVTARGGTSPLFSSPSRAYDC